MKKIACLILILIVSTFHLWSQTSELSSAEETSIYSQAIADYIKAMRKDGKLRTDTLYFGKDVAGSALPFAGLKLPSKIEGVAVCFISSKEGEKSQKEIPQRLYVNLVSWVNRDKAEFMFVAFSNGFEHQFDYSINYLYVPSKKNFILSSSRLIDPKQK